MNAIWGRESKEMSSNYPETGSGTDLLRQVLIGGQPVEKEVEFNPAGSYQKTGYRSIKKPGLFRAGSITSLNEK